MNLVGSYLQNCLKNANGISAILGTRAQIDNVSDSPDWVKSKIYKDSTTYYLCNTTYENIAYSLDIGEGTSDFICIRVEKDSISKAKERIRDVYDYVGDTFTILKSLDDLSWEAI